MVIIRINGIFYIITPSYMFRLSVFEPFRLKYYLRNRVVYTIHSIVVNY